MCFSKTFPQHVLRMIFFKHWDFLSLPMLLFTPAFEGPGAERPTLRSLQNSAYIYIFIMMMIMIIINSVDMYSWHLAHITCVRLSTYLN